MRSLWDEIVHSRPFWVSYVCAGVDFGGCPSLRADEQSLLHEPIRSLTLRFAVRHDFRWRADPELGWVAEGKDSYCMRSVGGLDLDALYASMCAAGNDPSLVQAILGLPDSRHGFNFAAFREFMRVVQST